MSVTIYILSFGLYFSGIDRRSCFWLIRGLNSPISKISLNTFPPSKVSAFNDKDEAAAK